jgi:6-phosphofructokinase 1
VGQYVAQELEPAHRFETRVSVLGHIQRGGSPTAHDRVLASRFGVPCLRMVARGEFGRMAALARRRDHQRGSRRCDADAERVPPEYFDVARVFFG